MDIKELLASEAGQAALNEAVAQATMGLKAKRDELLEANRKLKDELTARQAEASQATAQLGSAQATVQKLLVDNGLSEALTQAKVAPEFQEAARALIKAREQITIGEVDGKPRAMIGEKPLADFVAGWAQGDGRHFISSPGNSGGGAQAVSLGRGVEANPWAKETRNLAEQVRILKENPTLAQRLKAEAGRK